MFKSKKFIFPTDSRPSSVRRTTSESNHSISRCPNKQEVDPNRNEEQDNIQHHPALMRKKSHFFQIHQRDAIDTTPTIEFSPSDDDDDCGDSGRLPNQSHRCCDGPVIEELEDDRINSDNAMENTRNGSNANREVPEDDASSETSIISKRELRKRLARLLLRSCDIFDADNNLPGDQSQKYALR